jgi:hypothetical protein
LAISALGGAALADPNTIIITNTENEDLNIYVVDQNASGAPQIYPTGGQTCVLLPAGASATFDAALDANGNYNVVWTAEQTIANPVIETQTCAANPSQPCNVNMQAAAVATPRCQPAGQ